MGIINPLLAILPLMEEGKGKDSNCGKLIAEALGGTAERFDVFGRLPHATFPGDTLLRHPLLVLAMLWYAMRDRL